jgi:uncharacterized protein YrzB (UPF0473 family)
MMEERDENLVENGEEPEILVLSDDEGNEEEFEYLTIIPYEGKEYIVLLPMANPEDGEVLILQIEPIPGNEDEENYVECESDEIMQAVFDRFKEWYKDEYDFVD